MEILSVDIDYAFSPTISEYDDFIEGSRISLSEQDKIISDNKLPQPKVNLDKISLLRDVIKSKTNFCTPILIIENHHQIISFLPRHSSYNIYNFDHHHDIFYPGWHNKEDLDEGNWVYHLNNKGLKNYFWFKNFDSEDYEANLNLSFNFEERYLVDVEDLPSFDLVVFCKSTHWTGRQGKYQINKLLEDL